MRLVTLIILMFVLSANSINAQVDYEYQLKAGFIYQFTKFIDWKNAEDNNSEFIIGVLGESEIYPYLVEIAERKTIKSKVIVIETYVFHQQIDVAKEINYCDILFVPEKNSKYLPKLLNLADENTLLIGESDRFAEKGGAINFIELENRLMFELNKNAIVRNGFRVSTQLLKLAVLVEEDRN